MTGTVTGNSSGRRVLVVDDVEEMRTLIRRALSASGYQVDVAASLGQARALDPASYDAVLVDAGLGTERGVDLVEALRSADPAAAGRCLVITGGTADTIPDGVARLTKPFQLAQLLKAVHALHQIPPQARVTPAAAAPAAALNAASAAATAAAVPALDAAPTPHTTLTNYATSTTDGTLFPAVASVVTSTAVTSSAPEVIPAASTTPAQGVIPSPKAAPGRPRAAPDRGADVGVPEPPNARRSEARGQRPWRLLRLVRLLRARERHDLAGFLHDGPVQDLTAASLDLQMLARSAGPELAPRLAAAIRQLDTAAGSLRSLIDGHWPLLPPETRLADAVRQRTAWLLATPCTVPADVAPARLSTAETAVVADVAELMLLGLLPAGSPLEARVAVQAGTAGIQVELTLTPVAGASRPDSDPAPARAALDELAAALGVTAHADLAGLRWQAWLLLPRQATADPFQDLMISGLLN